ncbi:type VII secretion protein EccB [Kitasatospora arboriphila]
MTPFQAELMRNDPALDPVYDGATPKVAEMSPRDNADLAGKVSPRILDKTNLPDAKPLPPLNTGDKGTRSVVCSTFAGYDNGVPKRTVWAHTDYPAKVPLGSASAHVTPGHGLLYRAVDGQAGPETQDTSGTTFLITETGLRYSLQANNDGGTGPSPAPSAGQQQAQGKDEENGSQARLGYKSVAPSRVPLQWSILVPRRRTQLQGGGDRADRVTYRQCRCAVGRVMVW